MEATPQQGGIWREFPLAGTLAAPSIFLVGAIEFRWMSARRGSDKDRISPEEIRSLSRHFCRILVVQSHPPARSFRRNKNPQTHPEASLLVPTESGRRDFESLLERDSKAQPPVCIHWVSLHIAATRPRTEAGRSNGLWFQSFFVIWRQQQGGNCGGNPGRLGRIRPVA